MSFGFSVGDFIAVAKLIKDITICLKESGGAASDYRELVGELLDLQHVLNRIKNLEENAQNSESIKCLKVAALDCKFVLDDFQKKLEPYDKSLRQSRDNGWMKRSVKSVKWELTMKKDVDILRAYLQAHRSSLNMRLALEGM